MSDSDDDDDWLDYESGPYCRHWSELGFCESMCTCGHWCGKHYDDACDVELCPCEKFIDEDELRPKQQPDEPPIGRT